MQKLSFKIFFINEKKLLVLIVREKRRLNDPFKIFMRQNISKNVIFFLDSSLALFPSIFCQRRLVEEEFLSENLMLFSQTFFSFTLYDMSDGLKFVSWIYKFCTLLWLKLEKNFRFMNTSMILYIINDVFEDIYRYIRISRLLLNLCC